MKPTIEELDGSTVITWAGLAPGTAGEPATIVRTGERTVQAVGVAGDNIVIEGSLDKESWFALHDPFGLALNFMSPDLRAVLESPPYIRPRSFGSTDSPTILLSVRKS